MLGGGRGDGLPDPELAIRSELFSVERLEQHAETLAVAQQVTADPQRGAPLRARLEDNGQVLLAAYRTFAASVSQEQEVPQTAAWLVDNFHVVDEQLREVRDHLPPGFYRQLPKLGPGFLAGYPRVFGIAWAFVAHLDSRFDPEALRRFVLAYQRVQPLEIGELWAVAITLRIVLIETLRRLTEGIVHGRPDTVDAVALVTVRNVITSMRLISAFDWKEFFESVSLVDARS